MTKKNKISRLKRAAEIKSKRFLNKCEIWKYFKSADEYNNYVKHGSAILNQIATTIKLPRFMLSAVFLFASLTNKTSAFLRVISRLMGYVFYYPAKIVFPLVKITGKIINYLIYNQFTWLLSDFLKKFAGKSYHITCEIIFAIISKLISIPFIVWFASRFLNLVKNIFFKPIKYSFALIAAWASLFFAGQPSVSSLFALYIKALNLKIDQSGDSTYCNVVKAFLGDYPNTNKVESQERFINEYPLFKEGFENNVSKFIEKLHDYQELSEQDYKTLLEQPFSNNAVIEVIEAYKNFISFPNPIALTAIKYLLNNLPKNVKIPKNKYFPEISELKKEAKFFTGKKCTPLAADHVLAIPVSSSFDMKRIEAGKLAARILEAHLALKENKLHIKIVLPLKPDHDVDLIHSILNSLSKCYFPKTVTWTIEENHSDLNVAPVRGAMMVCAINNIVKDKNIADDTIIVLSEIGAFVSYSVIPFLSNAIKENSIITGSRHMLGSIVLNKRIPDKLSSLIYNTYSRLLIPSSSNLNDSSGPIKLLRKNTLEKLLPYFNLVSAGALDFSFDEALIAVAHCLSIKNIHKPIFWNNIKGNAKRSKKSIKAQLFTTRVVLRKKIRILHRLLKLKDGEKIFLTAGMDYEAYIDKNMVLTKKPVKPLNSLELLFAVLLRKDKQVVDHTKFGLLGRLAINILPSSIAKRLGVIIEGRYRSPASRFETLLPTISKCSCIEETKISNSNDDFIIEQKMLPLLLRDIFYLNIRYENIEGIESVLQGIVKLNEKMLSSGLMDAYLRSLHDTGMSTVNNRWLLKLFDFADLVTTDKNQALKACEALPHSLQFRRDFLEIKSICLSRKDLAQIFFDFYKDLERLYSKETINRLWKKNENQIYDSPIVRLHQKKDKRFLNNLTLLPEGIGHMNDPDVFKAQIALIPLIDSDYNIPSISLLPEPGVLNNSITENLTVVFLCSNKAIRSSTESLMTQNFPQLRYKFLPDTDSDVNKDDIRALRLKTICSNLENVSGDIILVAIDGESCRMRTVMKDNMPHKAFLLIDNYPILYWVLQSVITFLAKKTDPDELILFTHGDTLVSCNGLPGPALYAPKLICEIARALPDKTNNANQNRGLGKLLQARKGGTEFPGLFILKRKSIPSISNISLDLENSFWLNVSKMTRKTKGLVYKTADFFFDFDSPAVLWKFYLLNFLKKAKEKVNNNEFFCICNACKVVTNRVYISADSGLEIINEGGKQIEVELSNVVVTDGSQIKIIVPEGLKSVRIANAVFSNASGVFSFAYQSTTGILACNLNSKKRTILQPLSCYGVSGNRTPLFPEITG
ncbi:MAG: hypothetical protein FWD28_01640 [Treponema sp.]|nr:hypothetical protein [Treponema sp.]